MPLSPAPLLLSPLFVVAALARGLLAPANAQVDVLVAERPVNADPIVIVYLLRLDVTTAAAAARRIPMC
jgi:hypothetical protein